MSFGLPSTGASSSPAASSELPAPCSFPFPRCLLASLSKFQLLPSALSLSSAWVAWGGGSGDTSSSLPWVQRCPKPSSAPRAGITNQALTHHRRVSDTV